MGFKKYLKTISEEEGVASGTTSADIATVDTKLDLTARMKHLQKGKKCKKNTRF